MAHLQKNQIIEAHVKFLKIRQLSIDNNSVDSIYCQIYFSIADNVFTHSYATLTLTVSYTTFTLKVTRHSHLRLYDTHACSYTTFTLAVT